MSSQIFAAEADIAASTVTARGHLDHLTVELLWGTIDVLTREGRYEVTLDLAELSGIDEAGVKLLAALQHSLATHSGGLSIINACPSVCDALERHQVATRARK
jgi:anti-anti-sigma regulatory factor